MYDDRRGPLHSVDVLRIIVAGEAFRHGATSFPT
jgi:hypothetical protein